MSALRHHTPILCAAALISCTDQPSADPVAPRLDVLEASAANSGPSVSGHGNIVQQPSGELRTISFHAHVMPDGTVQGTYDNHNRQGDAVNHGEIDCLRLIGTNSAVMSGPVRKHTNPVFEGSRSLIRVDDNGEGADDPPDGVSMLTIFPPDSEFDCMTFTPAATFPIVGGNVQIRP